MARYTLYINFKEITAEYPLPAVNNRSIIIDMSSAISGCRLSFEVYDNVWSIKADDNISMEHNNIHFQSLTLSDGDLIKARLSTGEKFVIMVYEVTPFITKFTKYDLKGRNSVTLGKADSCDISVSDKFISADHAVFTRDRDRWIITDKSSNGTYINGSRIGGSLELRMYDIIYTVGFKMVFLGDCLALNRSDIVVCKLPLLTYGEESEAVPAVSDEDSFFSRSPRIIEPLFDDVTEIEGPPAPQKRREQPLLFVLGPSVTMPLPILMSTIVNNSQGGSFRWGTLVSVGVSAVLGAGWAAAHRVYNKKTMREDEEERVEAYKDYILKNENLLAEKHNYNSSILMTQFLSSENIIDRLSADNTFIWNRNVNHDDFLNIRIGMGLVKFKGDISVPKQRFSVHKDSMSELPHQIKEKYEYMQSSVAMLELAKNGIIGIIGNSKLINEAAINMVVQTAALHCYTDVKIAFFYTENEAAEFSWVRWLPHTYSDDLKLRMTADNPVAYQNVLYYINGVLRSRAESAEDTENKRKRYLPHYVIFCTSESIFEGVGIEKYISIADSLGVTFVLMYKKLDRLPNECNMIVECNKDYSGVYRLDDRRSEADKIKLDHISVRYADKFAREISKLHIRQYSEGEIPNSIEYFDMIGIGRLEQWDLIKKYKENRPYENLKAFLGIGVGGKPMYLDIHQKKFGPHGLVAGTTGSGKSETLQTFIVSLALNYHPNEVSFVLIDYKGGGMANAFIGMPHIAGTITNLGGNSENGELDPNIIRRALVSIKSEINRRMLIFKKYEVTDLDVYSQMYHDGEVSDPLPYLVIIADEFAELKKEQPEFMHEFIQVARVGRSLGVRMILATQKPGGVVDADIWSNSRFKLCLRVQDKQDSMDMLKRPEAAYLTQTGRAYLQLGNDEVFEQFQTGYSGAEYKPKDIVNAASESDIAMINIDGTPAIVRDRRKKSKSKGQGESQLRAAVRYIIDKCHEQGISDTRPLWLPVLSGHITLDEISRRYDVSRTGISAAYGFIDDPEKQRQFPAIIDLASCSNLIISGAAGIGKTTLLQTLLVGLMKNYSSEQVNFYILDFGGRTLKMFSRAPHCGLVAFSDDSEAVTRLFKFVDKSINTRKNLFNEANVGSFTEYVKNNSLPLMLIIIDNYFSFGEMYQNIQEDFMRLTHDCAKYGIQIIVTCNNFNDIKYKVKQNFTDNLTLVMAEKGDYREAWGITPEFLPDNKKGRGMLLHEGRLLEFQTLLPTEGENESDRNNTIINIISEISAGNEKSKAAEKIAVIPKEQTYSEFISDICDSNFVPVGYYTSDISVYGFGFKETGCYAVGDIGYEGISLVFNNIIEYARKIGGEVITVRLNNDVKLDRFDPDKSFSDDDGIKELLEYLRTVFAPRKSCKEKLLADDPSCDCTAKILEEFDKVFVMIDSMSEFVAAVNRLNLMENFSNIFKRAKGSGVAFIAGFDSPSYSADCYYLPVTKNFVSYKNGIELGGHYDMQKLFDAYSLTSQERSRQREHFIGLSVVNGTEHQIFVPHNS